MSESLSYLFESQNRLTAPPPSYKPPKGLDSYFQNRGKSYIPHLPYLTTSFEHPLPQIHLKPEPCTEELLATAKRQNRRIRYLENKLKRQNMNARFLDRRVSQYRNYYRPNKYAVKFIGYNLLIKDQQIHQLTGDARRYGINIV